MIQKNNLRKKITPYECFKVYLSIKAHFTSKNYDYFKYNGQIKCTPRTFDKRKDKNFFIFLSRKYTHKDIVQILTINHLKNSNFWVGDITNRETIELWNHWRGKILQFGYWFKVDCETIFSYPQEKIFTCIDKQHPIILKLAIYKEILPETVIVMDHILHFTKVWDLELQDDPIWSELSFVWKKYKPFLGCIDQNKYKKIIKSVLIEKYQYDKIDQ